MSVRTVHCVIAWNELFVSVRVEVLIVYQIVIILNRVISALSRYHIYIGDFIVLRTTIVTRTHVFCIIAQFSAVVILKSRRTLFHLIVRIDTSS